MRALCAASRWARPRGRKLRHARPPAPRHVTLTRGAPSRRGPLPRGGPSPAARWRRRRRPGSEAAGPPGPTVGDERRPLPRGRVTAGDGEGRARRGVGGRRRCLSPRHSPLRPLLSWRRGRGHHVSGEGAGEGAGSHHVTAGDAPWRPVPLSREAGSLPRPRGAPRLVPVTCPAPARPMAPAAAG